jgi:hypothetical protein
VKFFTLVLAASVAIVAWLQWWVALNKLRLDLFDRRYKVYDATRKFLSVIFREATFTDSQLFEFYAGVSDAGFLFGDDVVKYLEEIRTRAIRMLTAQHIFEPLPVGEERTRHVNMASDQLKWLTDQLTEMANVFAPYLGFANIRLRVPKFLSASR